MAETNSKTETKVVVFVNGQKYDVSQQVNVGTLIELGGGKPGEYELQQRDGDKGPIIKTYTNPNEVITVKNGEHFTTRFTGPINPA